MRPTPAPLSSRRRSLQSVGTALPACGGAVIGAEPRCEGGSRLRPTPHRSPQASRARASVPPCPPAGARSSVLSLDEGVSRLRPTPHRSPQVCPARASAPTQPARWGAVIGAAHSMRGLAGCAPTRSALCRPVAAERWHPSSPPLGRGHRCCALDEGVSRLCPTPHRSPQVGRVRASAPARPARWGLIPRSPQRRIGSRMRVDAVKAQAPVQPARLGGAINRPQ